jgi:hypothetical protein
MPSRQFITLEHKLQEINGTKTATNPPSPAKKARPKQAKNEFMIDLAALNAGDTEARMVEKFEISEQTVSDSDFSKKDIEASNSVGKISGKISGNLSDGAKALSGGSAAVTIRPKPKKNPNVNPSSEYSSFSTLEKVLVNINKRRTEKTALKCSKFQIELKQPSKNKSSLEVGKGESPAVRSGKNSPKKDNPKTRLSKLNLQDELQKEFSGGSYLKGALSCRYSQRPTLGIADIFNRSMKKETLVTARLTESVYPEPHGTLAQTIVQPVQSSCITLAEGLKELCKTQMRPLDLRNPKSEAKKSPVMKSKTFKKSTREDPQRSGAFLDNLRLTIIPKRTDSDFEEDLVVSRERAESESEEGAFLNLFESSKAIDDDTILIHHNASTLFNLPKVEEYEIPEDY